MKKLFLSIFISVLLTMILSSCGTYSKESEEKSLSNSKGQSNAENYAHDSNVPLLLSSEWTGSSGIYKLVGFDTSQSRLLHYIDKENNNEFVLCNKPNCKHDSESCNAYFVPSYISYYVDNSLVFEYKNNIFVKIGNRIVKMNMDGTDHENVIDIPDKYNLSSAYLRDSLLYIQATAWPDGNDSNLNDDSPLSIMLEVDLEDESCRELWSFKYKEEESLLGIYGKYGYYLWHTPTQPLSGYNQEALNAEENNKDVILYSVNMENGEREELIKATSFSIDPVVMAGKFIFYHSRKDEKLIQFNVETKESIELVCDLPGYIRFLGKGNDTILNNKLFYIMANDMTDAYADPPKGNDTFYVDLENKTNTKINFRTKKSNGKSENLTTLPEEKDGYYILPVQKEVKEEIMQGGEVPVESTLRVQYGCIKKEDFWAGNFDKITNLEWKDYMSQSTYTP